MDNYFRDIFSATNPVSIDEVLQEVQMVIITEMNRELIWPATEEEIKEALFLMHPEKAHGLDGMMNLFFQEPWMVI